MQPAFREKTFQEVTAGPYWWKNWVLSSFRGVSKEETTWGGGNLLLWLRGNKSFDFQLERRNFIKRNNTKGTTDSSILQTQIELDGNDKNTSWCQSKLFHMLLFKPRKKTRPPYHIILVFLVLCLGLSRPFSIWYIIWYMIYII